jgi:hypothetical protein
MRIDHFRYELELHKPREATLGEALNISTTVVAVHKVASFSKKTRTKIELRQLGRR